MSRHLFTSDLHLGHGRVAALRGYRYDAEHDEAVCEALAAHVGPDDVLWVLGDLVGSSRDQAYALALLSMLPGRKRLVLGNHDPAHPANRNAWKHTAALAEVFEWWGTAARTKVGGREVVLSHFPYHRDRGEPRFLQWRLPNRGAWLLHGHTHGTERATVEPARYGERLRYPASREVHVGWDAWRRPVADYEVADLMAAHE